jgi:hypothetical protein
MKVFETITTELQDFIRRQKMFFVATAPSMMAADGTHVNLSPKGCDCFRLVDESTALYLDMTTGSGNDETAAHVQENGRLTFMFCNMEDGPPMILRLYGRGEVILRPSPEGFGDDDGGSVESEWHRLVRAHFADAGVLPGSSRQIIVNHIERVQTSCGYGVPLFEYRGDQETQQDGDMEMYW